FTVSVSDCTCWRSASTSAVLAGVEFETAGTGGEVGAVAASRARAITVGANATAIKINFFIRTPDQNGQVMPTNLKRLAFGTHWISGGKERAKLPLPAKREHQRVRSARVARARRCKPQEMAMEPSAGAAPESLKIESREPAH